MLRIIPFMDPTLNIEDAKHLMEILDNDIPTWDKKNIALLLLILASNPDLVENDKQVVGYSPRTYSSDYAHLNFGDEDYCGYGC